MTSCSFDESRTRTLVIRFHQDSRLIKHLSGLQSKQHEVELLQQLLHTCINHEVTVIYLTRDAAQTWNNYSEIITVTFIQ